jgi:uncharacterized membrane protein
MYSWFVFAHIAGVLGFMLAHGVSVAVLLGLRRERDRARIATLLDLSGGSIIALYVSVLLLLGGGIAAGFAGNWWTKGWIWVSLGLFLAIAVSMYPLGSGYFRRIRGAVGMRPSGAPMVSDEELDELLRSSRAAALALIGFGGIVVILWLMVFKPF